MNHYAGTGGGSGRSARILSQLFKDLKPHMREGVTGLEVQNWCLRYLKNQYGSPSLFGLEGFPAHISVNRNATAAHAAPDNGAFLGGDLVTVDIAIDVLGWKADLAWTYGVPPLDSLARHILSTAWKASLLPLYDTVGIKSGMKSAILLEQLLSETDLRLCKGFAGHGIGREVHMQPIIAYFPNVCRFPNYSHSTDMFCWEPVLTAGNGSVEQNAATPAYRTADGAWTAQFEHMFQVSDAAVEILNLDIKFLKQGAGLRGTPPW